MHTNKLPSDENAAREIARNVARAHGDIEIDDNPPVSVTDDGFFVQAWIWVRREDVNPGHAHTPDLEDPDYCAGCDTEMRGEER